MMSRRVIVRGVSQRPDQRPEIRSRGQLGQVFADRQARNGGGDRPELTLNVVGSVGLHIKAVKLSQSPGKENEDHRPSASRGIASRRSKRGQMIRSKSKQTHRADLEGLSAIKDRVSDGC